MSRLTTHLSAALAAMFVLSSAAPARAAEPAPGTLASGNPGKLFQLILVQP